MTRDFFRGRGDDEELLDGEAPQRPAPGKVTLTSRLKPNVQRRATDSGSVCQPLDGSAYLAQPVQRRAAPTQFEDPFAFETMFRPVQAAGGVTLSSPETVDAAAARGIEAPSSPLPHFDEIQRSFGHHDVSHVQAHVGGAAASASAAMGASAYASGSHVGFASAPDLHTAAHEAAHTVQQKGGVQLKGGVGEEGDSYERHADAVADKVVRGESAEALLDQMAGGRQGQGGVIGAAVQQKKSGGGRGERKTPASGSAHEVEAAFADAMEALERGIKARDYFAANQAMSGALELLPRVDELLRPGPATSADGQAAIGQLRNSRPRFEELAPKAPSGGPPSEEERASWTARTPAPLAPVSEQSTPRTPSPPASRIPSSTEHAPITSDVPVRPDDQRDRAHEQYLGTHWDQLRDAAERHLAGHLRRWKLPRLDWAVDAERRAAEMVGAIFPPLHISGQLESLVAPDPLAPALALGLVTMQRPGEGDGDPTWNPSVGTAVARLLERRLAQSMERMGARYVAAYDASGGEVKAIDLARTDAMDGVAARLLTQEFVRVMGPLPKPERGHGARKPKKWHWLGKRDVGLWNWIEVTDPPDASAEDVVLLLPPDVPPMVEGDGRFFRMPEDWSRTQPGAAEYAPSSATVASGTELASSPLALDAAIAQAGDVPRKKATAADVKKMIAQIEGDIHQVVALLGNEYAARVVPAFVAVGAAGAASDRQRADVARVLTGQVALLREIVLEIGTFHRISFSQGRTRGGAAMESVYRELALAAGNSHLHAVGRRHLAAARTKAADVGRRLAEEAVAANGAAADKLAGSGGTGADDARERQRERFDQLDSNAPDPGSMDVEASIDAFLLHTQSVEEQLDAMANALFATNERMATIVGMPWVTQAEELGRAVSSVRDKAQGVRIWMIERLAQTPSAPARQALLERAQNALAERISATQIVDLSRRVVAMLEKIDRADRVIQIVSSALLALGISLIAAGAGIAVAAALTTPSVAAATAAGVLTAGRLGVAAAGLATEAFVGGWLQSEVMGDKPGEALAENLLGSLMSIAVLRGFHGVTQRFGPFTAENIALWERFGARGTGLALRTTHVTLEMVLGAGAGYAAQRIVRSPVKPTEDEALQWAMQGASIVASHWIIRRVSDARTRLAQARSRLPADAVRRLDGTLAEIDALHQRAQALPDRPVDQPDILELFAEQNRLVGAEAALVGAGDDGGGASQAEPSSHDAGSHSGRAESDAYAETFLTLAQLDQVTPGRWLGSEADVRRAASQAARAGLRVTEQKGPDGTLRWIVKGGGTEHAIDVIPEPDVVGQHASELGDLLRRDPDAFEDRYKELASSLAPAQVAALRARVREQRVKLVDEQPAGRVPVQQMVDEHARRMKALRAIGEFGDAGFHGSNSEMLAGLEKSQGQILSAAELDRRGLEPATGEGDSFTPTAGPKTDISIGHGDSGFGTSLAYADASRELDHYNTKRLTLAELDAQIARLTHVVDEYARVVVMDPQYRLERDHFASRRERLRVERKRRDRLPADDPRRAGGPASVDDYPVLFEFDSAGLRIDHRADVGAGEVFGGEAAVHEPVDLRQRVRRVYVPAANVADATAVLRTILGHEQFEVIALEAVRQVPGSENMAASHRKSLDQLRTNEHYFNAVVGAYDEAAATGKYLDDDLFWEHW